MKPFKMFYSVLIVCILYVTFNEVKCNVTTPITADNSVTTEVVVLNRPLDKGLDPLYKMTNTFLDIVQPDDAIDLLEQLQANQSSAKALSDSLSKQFNNDFSGTIQTILKFYIGYAACLAVGILFTIIFPLVGCIVCCCRCCCKKCGGNPRSSDPKHAKCKRWTYAIILIIISIFMLGAAVCAFMSNELIHEETQNEGPTAAVYATPNAVNQIKKFLDETVDEINSTAANSFDKTVEVVVKTLQLAAKLAKDRIGTVTNANALLADAKALANRVPKIKNDLEIITDSTTTLAQLSSQLDAQLTNVRNNLTTLCTNVTVCSNISVSNLLPDANFSKVQDSLKEVNDSISQVDRSLTFTDGGADVNITELVQKGFDAYENITREVDTQISNKIEEAENKTKSIKNDILSTTHKFKNETLKDITKAMGDVAAKTQSEQFRDAVKKYGDYLWYAGIAIAALLVLIVLFNFFGLLFGIAGERPGYDAGCCNKGVGANLLMASTFFSFLLGLILMIIVMVLFLVGGVLHTEVCKNMEIGGPAMKLADKILPGTLKGKYELSITDTFTKCKDNEALYTAANLASVFNLTQILDIKKHVDPALEDVKKEISKFRLNNITILQGDTEAQLNKLANANISHINFTAFTQELEKDITKISLNAVATTLDNLAIPASASRKTNLQNIANEIRKIENGTIKDMKLERTKLAESVEKIKKDTTLKDNVTALIVRLKESERNINKNGTSVIEEEVNKTVDEIKDIIVDNVEEIKSKVQSQLGRCRPVYDAYNNLYNTLCVRFLYPVNGFWFGVGWFLFFLIPSIVFCFLLVSLYRSGEARDKHGFNEGPYDDYQQGNYPSDTIPLDETRSMPKRNQRRY